MSIGPPEEASRRGSRRDFPSGRRCPKLTGPVQPEVRMSSSGPKSTAPPGNWYERVDDRSMLEHFQRDPAATRSLLEATLGLPRAESLLQRFNPDRIAAFFKLLDDDGDPSLPGIILV